MYDGLILIDKDSGWSSFDVVAKVRSQLRKSLVASRQSLETKDKKLETPLPKVKVGHTGTLDPLATGLMIVVVGSYCKRAGEFSKLDKVYEVQMKLGQTSTTGDEEGKKLEISNIIPEEEEIKAVLSSFVGKSLQTPPAYSAVKVGGQRAYKLAREGKEVVIEPREIEIYSLTFKRYEYPNVEFDVHVSSGTYIRSLVEDIGKKLGIGAYMSALRRTKVGKFKISEAISVEAASANALKTIDK